MQIIAKNIKETEAFAKDFVKSLLIQKPQNSATVIGLYGDLGTGKTTFTQIVTKSLGFKKRVNSPTFVIFKRYTLNDSRFKNMIHIDAYRLKNEKELLLLGWQDLLVDPSNIIIVEWPENVQKIIPKKHIKIAISHTKEGYRRFKINWSE